MPAQALQTSLLDAATSLITIAPSESAFRTQAHAHENGSGQVRHRIGLASLVDLPTYRSGACSWRSRGVVEGFTGFLKRDRSPYIWM